MCRRFIFVLIALVFGLTASAQATTVIWVSDNKAPTGGIPADQGWVDLLVAQGYDVDLRFRAQQARGLDTAEIAILNAADLIIVSRDTDSGQYATDDAERKTWNGIKTPIMLQVAHIARGTTTNTRWWWVNTGTTNDFLANPLEAVDPSHPIFNGVTLVANQVSVLTMGASFASITDPGNGHLIAKRADNNQLWIVEWNTGQQFYPGAAYASDSTPVIAGGPRMLFCSGSDEGTDGRYNLTAEGEKLFLNAVAYMSGYVQVNASEPIPADGAPVPPTGKVTGGVYMLLTFTAGETATSHTAYFSDDFNDVNDRDPAVNLGSPPYPDVYPTGYYVGFNTPEIPAFARVPLTTGKTYYWAVDESDGVSTFPGKVWSFRIVPEQAWDPTPVDGDLYVNADPNVALSWKLGSIITTGYNVSYDVYYGTVFADVNTSTTPTVHVILTSAVTGSLPANTVYYWRVDTKLNYSNPPFALYTTIKGDVWSFKTLPVVAITDPDLVGWWKLDGDIVPAIAFDSSGYANHGTLRGDPQWVSDEKLGGALAFDGVDDIVVVEQSRGLPIYNNGTDNAYSVAIWVKGGPQADRRVFSEGSTTSNTPLFNLGTQNAGATGQFDVLIRPDSGTTLNHAQSQAEPFDYTWHHVAWVDDNGTAMLYVDGVLDGTNFNYTRGTMALNTTSIGGILRAAPSYFFAGEIADVRVYKRVLSAREVKVIAGLLKASSPDPANLATGVARTPTLSWEAGAYAANLSGHNLYFSDNRDSVINRTTAKIVRTDPCYPVATTLDLGKAYYWAVDEVNGLNVWPGHLWSFTTVNYLVVDDMEKYQPNVPSPSIYQVWVDGAGDCASIPGNNSGALVDISTLAALTPVHGDQQAMKLLYDNDGTVNNPCPPGVPTARLTYSKAEALVAQLPSGIGSDWTAGGVTKALSLWFYGDPLNLIEPMWVRLTDASNNTAKVLYGKYADEDVKDVNEASWHEWLIDLGDFTGVGLTNVKSIAIGIGNEPAGPAGGSGTLYFDDIRIYAPRCILARRPADYAKVDYAPEGTPGGDCVVNYNELAIMTRDWLQSDYNINPVAPNPAGLKVWYKFDGNANDSSGNLNNGTENGGLIYAGGHTGQAVSLDGTDDYVSTTKTASQLGIGGNGPKTVSVWVYTLAFNNGGIFDVGTRVTGEDFSLRTLVDATHLAADQWWRIQYWGGDYDFRYDALNKWVHFAHVHDGTRTKIYADGQLIVDWAITINTTNTNPFQVGRYGWPDSYFNGMIDEFKLYNYALSHGEILSAANMGTLYVPVASPANVSDLEPTLQKKVNFKDYAELLLRWLDETEWP